MAACRTRENAHGEVRHLEQHVDIDQGQQDEKWQLLHHHSRIREAGHGHVVVRKQIAQNAQYGGGYNLVEAESDECAEPAPEEKCEFVEGQEGNHDGAEHTHHGAGDGAVPNDQAEGGGEECEHDLDKEKYQRVIRVGDGLDDTWSNGRLRLGERVLHGCDAVSPDDGDEVLGTPIDEALERVPNVRNGAVIERDEDVGEGEEHKQI